MWSSTYGGTDGVGPELGPQITSDFPSGMTVLVAAAERGVNA